MKRIKIILNSIAITGAIVLALATRFYMQHEGKPQYIPVINSTLNQYKPAGRLGTDYNCYDSNTTCTFYRPDSLNRPDEFLPAQKGSYTPANTTARD
jgi:Family of unknown function (DUF6520)